MWIKWLTNYQLQRAKVQGTPARLFTKANGWDKCLEEQKGNGKQETWKCCICNEIVENVIGTPKLKLILIITNFKVVINHLRLFSVS